MKNNIILVRPTLELKEKALDYYLQFVAKDANNEVFEIPEYDFDKALV